jgi:hypothetical protein
MEAVAMSCRQPGPASQAVKCFYCDEQLGAQVKMNLEQTVSVASGVTLSAVEEQAKPDPKKCVHVRAVCRNGHANLFFVDPTR